MPRQSHRFFTDGDSIDSSSESDNDNDLDLAGLEETSEDGDWEEAKQIADRLEAGEVWEEGKETKDVMTLLRANLPKPLYDRARELGMCEYESIRKEKRGGTPETVINFKRVTLQKTDDETGEEDEIELALEFECGQIASGEEGSEPGQLVSIKIGPFYTHNSDSSYGFENKKFGFCHTRGGDGVSGTFRFGMPGEELTPIQNAELVARLLEQIKGFKNPAISSLQEAGPAARQQRPSSP